MKKPRKTGARWTLAAAAAVVGVLVFARFVAVEAVYPVERAGRLFSETVGTRIAGLFRGAEAERENARLRRELADLQLTKVEAARIAAENARLRCALGLAERLSGPWCAAGVLSTGGGAAAARRTLRVDRGSLAGVRAGTPAVVAEGVVGLVSAVTPHTAEITLVTDPSVRVACELAGADGLPARGILCGGTEDRLVLRHLSRVPVAAEGRRVVTSGLGGVFPRGFAVGTLLSVRVDEEGLAHEGAVRPAVDFERLENVFVRCGP